MKSLIPLFIALSTFTAFASGGGGGGGTPAVTGVNPLPTTAPAPGVLLRESFGEGPDVMRPAGGKGQLKTDYVATSLGGFWVEYPGSKTQAWLAADPSGGGQAWRFAASSDNENETLPTPMQTIGNGSLASTWFDGVVANPTALMPFAPPATPWEFSVDVYPAVLAGAKVSVGLTSSAVLDGNLASVGQVSLSLRQVLPLEGFTGIYELRAGNGTGPVLASGTTMMLGFNTLSLRIDPVAHTVGATVNGTFIGAFPLAVAPKYLALEGQGIVDNLVVRLAP
jgi:hypothetical protein